jgi:hypothetical protein
MLLGLETNGATQALCKPGFTLTTAAASGLRRLPSTGYPASTQAAMAPANSLSLQPCHPHVPQSRAPHGTLVPGLPHDCSANTPGGNFDVFSAVVKTGTPSPDIEVPAAEAALTVTEVAATQDLPKPGFTLRNALASNSLRRLHSEGYPSLSHAASLHAHNVSQQAFHPEATQTHAPRGILVPRLPHDSLANIRAAQAQPSWPYMGDRLPVKERNKKQAPPPHPPQPMAGNPNLAHNPPTSGALPQVQDGSRSADPSPVPATTNALSILGTQTDAVGSTTYAAPEDAKPALAGQPSTVAGLALRPAALPTSAGDFSSTPEKPRPFPSLGEPHSTQPASEPERHLQDNPAYQSLDDWIPPCRSDSGFTSQDFREEALTHAHRPSSTGSTADVFDLSAIAADPASHIDHPQETSHVPVWPSPVSNSAFSCNSVTGSSGVTRLRPKQEDDSSTSKTEGSVLGHTRTEGRVDRTHSSDHVSPTAGFPVSSCHDGDGVDEDPGVDLTAKDQTPEQEGCGGGWNALPRGSPVHSPPMAVMDLSHGSLLGRPCDSVVRASEAEDSPGLTKQDPADSRRRKSDAAQPAPLPLPPGPVTLNPSPTALPKPR